MRPLGLLSIPPQVQHCKGQPAKAKSCACFLSLPICTPILPGGRTSFFIPKLWQGITLACDAATPLKWVNTQRCVFSFILPFFGMPLFCFVPVYLTRKRFSFLFKEGPVRNEASHGGEQLLPRELVQPASACVQLCKGAGAWKTCCAVLCGCFGRVMLMPVWPSHTPWGAFCAMGVRRGVWAARKLLCGGGMAWAPGEGGGGGVPEMGFCAGPFVLCKDGCCRQRRRNTNFGPEKTFFTKKCSPTYV